MRGPYSLEVVELQALQSVQSKAVSTSRRRYESCYLMDGKKKTSLEMNRLRAPAQPIDNINIYE